LEVAWRKIVHLVLSKGINLNNKNMNPDERAPLAATVKEIEAGLLDQRIDDLIAITGDRICKTNASLCDAATARIIQLIENGALDDKEEALREFASNHAPHVNISKLEEPSRSRLKVINEKKAEEEEEQKKLQEMTLAEYLAKKEEDDKKSDQ
jgi:hypothetical protein